MDIDEQNPQIHMDSINLTDSSIEIDEPINLAETLDFDSIWSDCTFV